MPVIANQRIRTALEGAAQLFAILTAASLPWSTSATSICAGAWVLSLLPLLLEEVSSVGRTMRSPAAFLPVGLVALAVVGMLWADVSWAERFKGLSPFIKLLTIPLLMWQFSRYANGERVLLAFFVSACALLALSFFLAVMPQFSWREVWQNGIPVKDYISQSSIFTLCAFALLAGAAFIWQRSRLQAVLLAALAGLFVVNILFIALARTSLVVMVILVVLLGFRCLSRTGLIVLVGAAVLLSGIAWTFSEYLRHRVENIPVEIQSFSKEHDTSSGARLEFWRNSLAIIGKSPVLGHGTGSTRAAFSQQTGVSADAAGAATNPHNQIFAVAIPLGIVGALILIGLWVAHVRLFLKADFVSWIGLSVVVQNIVGSLFNSHLFDFTPGWIYVFGVGVAGGLALRARLSSTAP